MSEAHRFARRCARWRLMVTGWRAGPGSTVSGEVVQHGAVAHAERLGDDDRVERGDQVREPGDPQQQRRHVGRGEQFFEVADRDRPGCGLALLVDQQVGVAVAVMAVVVVQAAAQGGGCGRVQRRLGWGRRPSRMVAAGRSRSPGRSGAARRARRRAAARAVRRRARAGAVLRAGGPPALEAGVARRRQQPSVEGDVRAGPQAAVGSARIILRAVPSGRRPAAPAAGGPCAPGWRWSPGTPRRRRP